MKGAVAETDEPGRAARPGRALAALACLVVGTWGSLLSCISTSDPKPSPDALRIGAVLPFSGDRAASGVPLEAALRLAVDEVNASGGLAGRPLWLDVADSHSDDVRGTQNAISMIEALPIPYFIGTEEPKIAYQITSEIKQHGIVHLMPGLTSAQFHDPSAAAAWFRLSPSVSYLACSLAKRVVSEGLSRVSVVVDGDDYSNSFAVRFGAVLRTKANTATPSLLLDPQSSSFADVFSRLTTLSAEAIVLMSSPALAAKFLQEWALRGRPIRIYLGPTLKDPALLRNVPTGILEGLIGVSADVGEQAAAFANYLEERTNVIPVAGSHYYFDAAALLSLALAEGLSQKGVLPSPTELKQHMISVTSEGGSVASFDRLGDALALLAAGQKVTYKGAAGSYVLNSLGDSTLNRGSIWQIVQNDFVTLGPEQCDKSDIDKNFDPL